MGPPGLILAMALTLNFQGQTFYLLYLKQNGLIATKWKTFPPWSWPSIHPSTKSPLAGASASCCQAQSSILSNMAALRCVCVAQNLFLAISVIMVVLSIQRSYNTDGNHTFIIPDCFSYQMRISGRYFKASSFWSPCCIPWLLNGWWLLSCHMKKHFKFFLMLW